MKKTWPLVLSSLLIISLSVGSTLLIQNTLLNPAPKQQTALPVIEPKPPVAQIVQVKPHYATTTSSRRICHPTQRIIYVQSHYYPGVGAVIGGVTGAVVGNTIINGSSRTAATIAGAAIGAVGGNAIQRNMHQPKPQVIYQNVCSKQTSSKKIIKGYEVTYNFNGQNNMIVMQTRPTGNTLTLPIQEY